VGTAGECKDEAKKGKDRVTTFTPHVIDEDSGIGTQFAVGDVNGDGLLAIVVSNKKGTFLLEQVRAKKPDVADKPSAKEPKNDDKEFVPLFNGKDMTEWTSLNGEAPQWEVKDGYLEAVPGRGDIRSREDFGPDFKLHVEFWLPLMPSARGQGRANSGVFLQGRYEVQILDSYLNDTNPDDSIGALYLLVAVDKGAQRKAIRPPEQWQYCDITFHAPRVDGTGKVAAKGHITVVLNGVTIINDGQFDKAGLQGSPDNLDTPGPIRLQEHGAKVRFRNIGIKKLPPLNGVPAPNTLK
jgi:hypothetical protein